ncbi:hypothetical protein GQR36_18040 [Enterococcus termitis]
MVYLGESKEFSGTFGDWANIWLNNIMSIKLKESTYASYSNNLQIHIFPFLEQRPLKKITPTEMDQLVRKLSNSLAPSSVHIVFRIVKSCLEAARERGYIYLNPCERTSLPKNDKKYSSTITNSTKSSRKGMFKNKKRSSYPISLRDRNAYWRNLCT